MAGYLEYKETSGTEGSFSDLTQGRCGFKCTHARQNLPLRSCKCYRPSHVNYTSRLKEKGSHNCRGPDYQAKKSQTNMWTAGATETPKEQCSKGPHSPCPGTCCDAPLPELMSRGKVVALHTIPLTATFPILLLPWDTRDPSLCLQFFQSNIGICL